SRTRQANKGSSAALSPGPLARSSHAAPIDYGLRPLLCLRYTDADHGKSGAAKPLTWQANAACQQSSSTPLTISAGSCYQYGASIARRCSGRGAVWLARLNGVQEVAGSNPVAPTLQSLVGRKLPARLF